MIVSELQKKQMRVKQSFCRDLTAIPRLTRWQVLSGRVIQQ